MLPLLLLQAVADHPASLEGEIAGHPYITAALVAVLFSVVVMLLKLLLTRVESRVYEKLAEYAKQTEESFAMVNEANGKQDGRLDRIDEELHAYEKDVAIGKREAADIHEALNRVAALVRDHTEREEGATWGKIDSLVAAVYDLKLANEAAHGSLVAGQAVLATRIDAVEKKMPNGELSKLAEAFANLSRHRDEERAQREQRTTRSVKRKR